MPNTLRQMVTELATIKRRLDVLETQDGPEYHLAIADGATAPATESGVGRIFIDEADGDLKILFGTGSTTSIVTT